MSEDVSKCLGRLEAQNEALTRQNGVLFRKVDELGKSMSEMLVVAKETSTRQAEIERQLEEDVMPAIKDYKKLRNQGLGIIAAIGLIGGGAGMASSKLWKFLGFG